MTIYFAPMEGITGYRYRNAHYRYFKGIDKYFTPFIATNQYARLSSKEKQDVLPENNGEVPIVPQILSNQAKDFIATAKQLQAMGYEVVNLNLGCPSGTVVAKGKGSGFLAYPEALERFLDQVFGELDMKLSIKTRLGKESSEEAFKLMTLYNQYPLEELIIHPRVQADYYRNTPDLQCFKQLLQMSKHKLCYNGDIFNLRDYEKFKILFPEVDCIMLGRGLLAQPALAELIRGEGVLDQQRLKSLHDEVYQAYKETLYGDRNLLFKMKELWAYMIQVFEAPDKQIKKIRKAQSGYEYEAAVEVLFETCQLIKDGGFKGPHSLK